MTSRLALRWSMSTRVLLVALAFHRPASAQDLLPFEPEAGPARIGDLESTVAVAFEGVVRDPTGAPAEGAVVVSSAGGKAVTDWHGAYRLDVQVPVDAESVEITAVGRAGQNLLANARVALPRVSGPLHLGPLVLAQGATCSPSWVPTFGGQSGTGSFVHALTVFDDGGGTALYAGGYFTTAGGVVANYIAKWDGSSWAPLGSGMNGEVLALTVYH
jgi:hypothetical protein